MLNLCVRQSLKGRKGSKLLKENDVLAGEPSWLNAKALYDEAHEHLKLYETLYAQAHAIDMACRRRALGGVN